MADRSRWWYVLPEPVRAVPADLAAVVALVVLTVGAVFLPVVDETPLRIVVGLLFVLFVPGYAFIAALFPETGPETSPTVEERFEESPLERGGIDGIERVALSFGTSIAIVPLLGLVLNFTPWGIRLVPIVVAIGGVTLGCAAVASHRRRALPPEERFAVPYQAWAGSARAELLHPESGTDAALNVLLVVSVLLAAGSVGYAVAVPKQGESFSELYLLTENESGALVADDYPTEFTAGQSKSLTVGIGNHEHRRVNYTVVTELQRVRIENNSTHVRSERELDRFRTTLASNETWHYQHEVTPTMTGDRLRLTYLLYRGDPPADPSIENAYRENHLWINVTARNASSTARVVAE